MCLKVSMLLYNIEKDNEQSWGLAHEHNTFPPSARAPSKAKVTFSVLEIAVRETLW